MQPHQGGEGVPGDRLDELFADLAENPTGVVGRGFDEDSGEGSDGSMSDLDAAFAELSAGGVSRGEVRDQVDRVFTAITTPGAQLGSEPRGRGPRPIVEHNARFDVFGPGRVQHLALDTTSGGVVQVLVVRGDEQLAGLVPVVRERFLAGQAGADRHAEAVTELLNARQALPTLRTLVGTPTLDIPLPQAAAVVKFFARYPDFLATLPCKLVFASREANGRGGGVYKPAEQEIHISQMLVTPPGAFLRLLVHEIGHPMFELALLDHRPMPVMLATDDVTELRDRFDRLDDSGLTKASESLAECQAYWNQMSSHAKTFYRSWRTLRRADQYLLGLDLWEDPNGHRLSPRQRQAYQAEKFGEFCAETFMQYAMGDLHGHVMKLLADPTVPAGVKSAWRNAWSVVEELAERILGRTEQG
ncbi:hypothetical protein JOD54_005543 [Actinokineospora baliensis]|uniref:hypothetical protein n=1 Tax=Actinokineospora baliensis TaxID=547056 RepID=UPI00195C0027|nr:hypothetical protein [Actinokineospora baliensis]MBM7775339.1 hypothetical protein [Actinokineospora baliensis]